METVCTTEQIKK